MVIQITPLLVCLFFVHGFAFGDIHELALREMGKGTLKLPLTKEGEEKRKQAVEFAAWKAADSKWRTTSADLLNELYRADHNINMANAQLFLKCLNGNISEGILSREDAVRLFAAYVKAEKANDTLASGRMRSAMSVFHTAKPEQRKWGIETILKFGSAPAAN